MKALKYPQIVFLNLFDVKSYLEKKKNTKINFKHLKYMNIKYPNNFFNFFDI